MMTILGIKPKATKETIDLCNSMIENIDDWWFDEYRATHRPSSLSIWTANGLEYIRIGNVRPNAADRKLLYETCYKAMCIKATKK